MVSAPLSPRKVQCGVEGCCRRQYRVGSTHAIVFAEGVDAEKDNQEHHPDDIFARLPLFEQDGEK